VLRSKRVIPSIAWAFGLPPPPASPSPGRASPLVVWDGWRSPLVTCSHWPLVARSLVWLVTCQSPLVSCSLGWVPGGRNGRGFGMVAATCEAMPLANAFPIQGFWNVGENWRLYRIRARLQSCRQRPSLRSALEVAEKVLWRAPEGRGFKPRRKSRPNTLSNLW
jgi:hypothetical protein